jgi:predicted membrane-bound spermidine synthase
MAPHTTSGAGAARFLLPALVLLSGFCGISYEILYAKLLGNVLGNQFVINGTVLLTFLLGIGFGTLYAHRLLHRLWAVEAGIGLYAAAFVVAYGTIEELLYSWVPGLGTSILACAAASFLLLATPAFLIGCSLPLFASYLASLRSTHVFSRTYAIYNVGAAATALAMEFVLLRRLGLAATTLLLAALNAAVAAALVALVRLDRIAPTTSPDPIRFPRRSVIALVLASVASAVFQLMMIKVAEFVFGPYHETFSLVLAVVLAGLAAGSLAAGRLGLSFRGALVLAAAGAAWLLATLPASITVFAAAYPGASDRPATLVLLKLGMVVAWMGPAATGFGATIPALLHSHRDVARESGRLLFWSSIANAAGFLLMAFVLHRLLDYGPLLVLVAVAAAAALVIEGGLARKAAWVGIVSVAVAVGAWTLVWDEMLLYVGHTNFHDLDDLRAEKRSRVYADRFKGPQDVFAITWKDGKPFFFINGYVSIPLSASTEKIVGAVSSMLAPRLDRALVLGVGTGATAGTVGLVFERTDAVEINRVVLDNLHLMAEYNFDIEHRPAVNIVHDDGIRFVKTSDRTYSMILNTVETPLYFSSSKLYTKEFFEQVRDRLEPDGVYVTWIDWRIGDEGFDIIIDTLRTAFDHAWMLWLDSNYFLLVASNEEIGLRQHGAVAGHPELHEYFVREYELPPRLLPYAVLVLDAFALAPDEPAPINTRDYPVLEHRMARLQDNARFLDVHDRIERHVDMARVRDALSPAMDWRPGELLAYADLRVDHRTRLGEILDLALSRSFDGMADRYREAALVLAEEVGTGNGWFRYGVRLWSRSQHEAAIEALSRSAELAPRRNDTHLFLGLSYHATGRWEEALGALLDEWEIDRDPRVPLAAGKTLIRLERYDEALEWLAQARAAGTDDEEADIHYFRGVANEGLDNVAAARHDYGAALSSDADYALAREALERLGAPGAEVR